MLLTLRDQGRRIDLTWTRYLVQLEEVCQEVYGHEFEWHWEEGYQGEAYYRCGLCGAYARGGVPHTYKRNGHWYTRGRQVLAQLS
jgi:hypothetical protein